MPIHHRAANLLYDYPFTTVLSLAVPIAGLTLREGMKLKHISWTSRLMQTRVYAQGGILLLLLSTMAFRDYMDKKGRFPEPGEVIKVKEKYRQSENDKYKELRPQIESDYFLRLSQENDS